MSLRLRTVTTLEEARRHAPRLDSFAAASMAEFSDEPFPTGACERFFARSFEAPETVLVLAEDPGQRDPVGVCLVGPLLEPLLGTAIPLILVLHVDSAQRHLGLAKELVREAQRRLALRGARTIAARAGHNDDALISMGERWGFTRLWELMVLD